MKRWAGVAFTKVSGGGNDFILLDGEASLKGVPAGEMARVLCPRGQSVGADGLLVVDRVADADLDLRLSYFNADGSRAFCGNGTLCVAHWAHHVAGLPAELRLSTDGGPVRARVRDNRVQVEAPPIRDWRDGLSLAPAGLEGHGTYLKVGCPHLVVRVPELPADAEFLVLAQSLRHHPDLAPDGANVDFISVESRHSLSIRTFERGVEGETLASGTGCLAGSLAAAAQGAVASPVSCLPRGGENLKVCFRHAAGRCVDLSLEGGAHLIYSGVIGCSPD